MQYIEKPSGSGNIFVDLPAQDDDEKNLIVFRGQTAFVIMNAFPYTNGHLLVAPYRQTNDMTTMSDAELLEIHRLIARCIAWLTEIYRPDGFNVGLNLGRAAGAGIPQHLHWHIVPRWNGDTNFMTTVGEVRVMPQAMDESYRKIRAAALADASLVPSGENLP
jgi:ATP adenylyltransferase